MAADFSWEKCASEMMTLYKNLLSQRTDRRLAAAHQL